MRLSPDKILHIANRITEGLRANGLVQAPRADECRKEARAAVQEYMSVDDAIDTAVRAKISSLSRRPPEGSQEWQILYTQYFREEESRRGR